MPESTIQPGASAGIDTVIKEDAATTNFGTSTAINVELVSDGSNRDVIIKFDLSGIAQGSIIQVATLKLYLVSQTGGAGAMGTGYISRIKSANSGWTEAGATWNTIDGSTAWAGSVGCETSGTDFDPDALWSGDLNDFPISQFNDYALDVGIFQKMIDIGNYGMKIWSGVRSPSVGRGAAHVSSDHATSANHPKLYVRWLEPKGRLVEYTFNIWDPQQQVLDAKGAAVQPNEIRPNNWMRVWGFELPRGRAYASLVTDPSVSYIVGTTYDEDQQSVDIKTNRNQFADMLLRRLSR